MKTYLVRPKKIKELKDRGEHVDYITYVADGDLRLTKIWE